MGVRAIEQETGPLGTRAGRPADSLREMPGAVRQAAERFAAVDRDLDLALPALRVRE